MPFIKIPINFRGTSESVTPIDANFYEFTTTEAGTIEIAVTDFDSSPICHLFDSSLILLDSLPATLGSITYPSESAVNFYLVVYSSVETDYTLTLSFTSE